ncbi:hypothetical protein E4U42_006557 [Claviceps africana]|uniref:Uncharacterized protein n=1 Tax=Claviceps africana TaxID=83212 RepID=A0A8K0J2U8_9HYPO|nr:hypothetical protein E4U42_006557 [Claviceps africana]
MSASQEDGNVPPPSSQSHFAKYQDFVPNDAAPFDGESARLASSQNWIPGTQAHIQERTIAPRDENVPYVPSRPSPLTPRGNPRRLPDPVPLRAGPQAVPQDAGQHRGTSSSRGARAARSRCGTTSAPTPSRRSTW